MVWRLTFQRARITLLPPRGHHNHWNDCHYVIGAASNKPNQIKNQLSDKINIIILVYNIYKKAASVSIKGFL